MAEGPTGTTKAQTSAIKDPEPIPCDPSQIMRQAEPTDDKSSWDFHNLDKIARHQTPAEEPKAGQSASPTGDVSTETTLGKGNEDTMASEPQQPVVDQ